VKFNEELTKKEIFEDGHGKTPVDAVTTGRLTSVVAKFTRSSLTQLEKMIESSVAGANNLKVINSVGNSMFIRAEELILKKLVDNTPSADPNEWLHVHRTFPIAKPSFDFDNDNQRLIEVEFMCFPDDFSTRVNEIWRMGPA
jgi:hypothetical protein